MIGSRAMWMNPIVVQHVRSRLRPMPTLTWGIITLTVVAFIFALVFLSLTEREALDPVAAAKAALVPLIVVQGVILMGLGTSAVATGIARERDQRLLDYHRMTPMSPGAKIVGTLFGLPAREYFLFALTLPFVGYAVIRGGIPLGKVLQFYVVFFSSVWLYHMTGLMAGMVSKKPWHSSFISLGLVAGLYLFLPQFARFGLSFLDYLTVRPTFYGMVAQELQTSEPGPWSRTPMLSMRYREVSFFGLQLNPTVFSLLVQVFALGTMYHVVRRKWLDPAWHALSKGFSLVFMAGVLFLLVGSLWPLVLNPTKHQQWLNALNGPSHEDALPLFVGLFFVVCVPAVLLAVSLITPTAQSTRKGYRRAKKLGLRRAPWSWDSASSLPWTLALILMAMGAFVGFTLSIQAGPVYDVTPVMWRWLVVPAALLVTVALTVQGMLEVLSRRAVLLMLFLLWAVPVMAGVVLLAAFEAWKPAMYLGTLCPATAGGLSLAFLLDTMWQADSDRVLWQSAEAAAVGQQVIVLTVGLYSVLMLTMQVLRIRVSAARRQAEDAVLPGRAAMDSESEPQPKPKPKPEPDSGSEPVNQTRA